jgi:hypothetical protein
MVMGDDTLSVALWRGYVTGRFYARPADRDVAVALSPSFRIASLPWETRVPLDQNPSALHALDALRETLAEAGWQHIPAGAGSRWYQLAFGPAPRSGLRPARSQNANGVRIHVAERVREARTDISEVPQPTLAKLGNGHGPDAVARKIVAALRTGPLTSSELCSRISHSSGAVRIARRELEVAGLVQKAARPAGGSKRAIYWQLSRTESGDGQPRDGERAVHEVNGHD